MRTRIRMTNRRQLKPSDVTVEIQKGSNGNEGRNWMYLEIANKFAFNKMPLSASIKLRLSENKTSKTLSFGTLGRPQSTADIPTGTFAAPSCQLRIVSTDEGDKGRVLGSTDKWTLRPGNSDGDGKSEEGMLRFQPDDIDPLIWKLDIRDDDHPILYIDKKIPQSEAWAKTNPVFLGCVLPEAIRQIFQEIIATGEGEGDDWRVEWIKWAAGIMPGTEVPSSSDTPVEIEEWIDNLIQVFSRKHGFMKSLVASFDEESAS